MMRMKTVFAIGLLLFVSSCATNRGSDVSKPDWINNPPELCGVGTVEDRGQGEEMARSTTGSRARDDLSRSIELTLAKLAEKHSTEEMKSNDGGCSSDSPVGFTVSPCANDSGPPVWRLGLEHFQNAQGKYYGMFCLKKKPFIDWLRDAERFEEFDEKQMRAVIDDVERQLGP